MRKLIYVSKSGKETGSWEVAENWNESYTVRLDEVKKEYTKEERERLEKRWAKLEEVRKARKNRNA